MAAVQVPLDSALKLDKDTGWIGITMITVFGLAFGAACKPLVVPALCAALNRFDSSAKAARPSS